MLEPRRGSEGVSILYSFAGWRPDEVLAGSGWFRVVPLVPAAEGRRRRRSAVAGIDGGDRCREGLESLVFGVSERR